MNEIIPVGLGNRAYEIHAGTGLLPQAGKLLAAGAKGLLEAASTPKDRHLKAVLMRRLQDPAAALAALEGLDPAAVPDADAERGLILFRQGKLDDAAKALEAAAARKTARTPEALYHLAHIDRLRARDADATRRLAALAISTSVKTRCSKRSPNRSREAWMRSMLQRSEPIAMIMAVGSLASTWLEQKG